MTRVARAGAGGVVLVAALVSTAHAASGLAQTVRPTQRQITAVMRRTVEVSNPKWHFHPWGRPVTIADGHGGSLTAEVGVRWPTADGYGQLVFFWHNRTFLGWNSRFESTEISLPRSQSAGRYLVTFAHYRPSDPACCPSLRPVRIAYSWDGRRLRASRKPPDDPGHPVAVMLTRG